MKQSKLRTKEMIVPNNNICFPIGTILSVQKQYQELSFHEIFSKFKKKGLDLNSLIMGLISYKLTENFSISKASEWINRPPVLDIFELEEFEERTLFRTLRSSGKTEKRSLLTSRIVCSINTILSTPI